MRKTGKKPLGVLLTVFVGLWFGLAGAVQAANEAGVVINLSGALSAKGADGALRLLAVKSEVLSGDTLYTAKNSYARIKFADGGEIVLRPETHFAIENFHFQEGQPNKDSATLNLIKGGLRAISGMIGKRGDPDSYAVKTRAATIGIRGTNYGALYCQDDCGGIPTPSGKPPENGLHVDVAQGTVVVVNKTGSQLFNAGQFGFVKDTGTPPITVPSEQGIKVTAPTSVSSDNAKSGSAGKGQGAENCVVK